MANDVTKGFKQAKVEDYKYGLVWHKSDPTSGEVSPTATVLSNQLAQDATAFYDAAVRGQAYVKEAVQKKAVAKKAVAKKRR